MSYPRQDSTAKRLQEESWRALDRIQASRWRFIERQWNAARVSMRRHILDVYQQWFGGEKWNLIAARSNGSWHILSEGLRSLTVRFRDASRLKARDSINELYRESLLRHAWVLDQTTPPNIRVRIPNRLKLFEASRAVAFYTGPEAAQKFGERWNAWSDGYYSALMTNLQMNALNESTASDAAAEVDATRVNTPAYGLLDALQRLFDFETYSAMTNAVHAVSQVNEEMDVQEIWEIRRDMKVCDDCAANEGLPEEEWDGEIPLHPNCRCYTRIVPKSWAELLRSGDVSDYDLAVSMDAHGLVPNAMAVKDAFGNLAAYTTVDFNRWQADTMRAIAAR